MKIWFPFLLSLVSIYNADIGSTTFVQMYILICRIEYQVADTTGWNFDFILIMVLDAGRVVLAFFLHINIFFKRNNA